MAVVGRLADTEQSTQTNIFVDANFYINLKTTFEVILVYRWGEFMQKYHHNELDDRLSRLEKGQTVTKSAEEIAVELDGEMSMGTELIGKYITEQVAAVMAKKTKQYEKKNKNLREVEQMECRQSWQKTV